MKIEDIVNKVISTPNSAFFYTPNIYGKSDSYLFFKPKEIVTVKSLRNLNQKLKKIDELIEQGYYGYSLMNYEAGYLFEKTLNYLLPKNHNLIQFFFYNKNDVQKIKSTEIDFNEIEKYSIKNFKLNTTKSKFKKIVKAIRSFIEEGDTYQVNYTVKGKFNFLGSYTGLFSNLVFNQSAEYTCIINNSNDIIISLSPELFFEKNGRKIISKPMKGTVRRGNELSSDVLIKYDLIRSEKNRAENLMIVDLIRNDFGRISKYGSVEVKKLFDVEKYESVYQMVSTIKSKINNNIKLIDILKNIYPCGSITGAPKIRTMEIISELEDELRGIYTGGIGLIRNNKITFNVPIRTLSINKETNNGEIGLGSGIVWDSNIDDEYEETKLKGKFLTKPEKPFKLFETMLVENSEIFLLDEHLDRMQQSADYFLFRFNRIEILDQLNKILEQNKNSPYRLKIKINKFGSFSYQVTELSKIQNNINVIVSARKINSQNRFQYFKTTNRKLYDREYKKYLEKGFFDVIYLNEKNEVSEGAISNIFVYKNNLISTPQVNAGILSGVYRKYLLKNNPMIREQRLHLSDLLEADRIILSNSVRREVFVNKLFIDETEYISFKSEQ